MSVNVVAAFNEAVDARDLDRLDAWRDRNVFDDARQVRTDEVVGVGRPECPERRLHGPAQWSATVVDGRVRRWQVDDA